MAIRRRADTDVKIYQWAKRKRSGLNGRYYKHLEDNEKASAERKIEETIMKKEKSWYAKKRVKR
jgi:hypothetical protein